MIPYVQLPALQLGPITFHPFGVLAAMSAVAGLWYARRIAEREFGAGRVLLDMAPWFLIIGLFSSHVAALVFYFPDRLSDKEFWTFFNVTSGLSSYGGLLGGALGAYIFVRRQGLRLLPWLDVLARGFSLAFIFGRIGCSIVHDHPGLPTEFFLAVDYPAHDHFPAGPRHDLGFYELLFWLITFPAFHWLGRKRRPDGFFLGLLIVWYAPCRFFLDFLRTNDLTYFYLTFAQWCCLLVLPAGIWLLRQARVDPRFSEPIPSGR